MSPGASHEMRDEPQDLSEVRAAAVRGLKWVVVARPMVEITLLGSMLILSRLISPAEFGRFAVAALVGGLGVVSAAAVTTALVQRPELDRDHLQAGFALALLLAGGILALTFVVATLLVVPVFGARTAELVRLTALGCPIAALGVVPSAKLQRRLELRRLSLIDVLSTATRAAVSVALALVGLGATALVLGGLCAAGVMALLAFLWARPPLPYLRWRPARDLLSYGLPAWAAAVSWIGFANCDYAIVGARLGPVQAGYYFRAYTLGVEYQKKVSSVMASVGFPVLARTRTGADMDELRGQMVRLLTVLLFPCLALLAIVAPVAVPWLFGARWRPAVAPTQLLAIGGAATLLIDSAGATLMAAGRAVSLLAFGWANFAAYGAAVWVTAPLGLTGVAAAAAVAHTAFVFVAYYLMFPEAPRSVPRRIWGDVAPALVPCSALVGVGLPLSIVMSSAGAPALIYLVVVSTGATVAYVLALRVFFPAELASVVRVISHLVPHPVRSRRARAVETRAPSAAVEG